MYSLQNTVNLLKMIIVIIKGTPDIKRAAFILESKLEGLLPPCPPPGFVDPVNTIELSLQQSVALFEACCKILITCLTSFDIDDTILTKPVITCSKLTIETLEQGVKCVQS